MNSGLLNFKYIMSCIIIQLSVISIFMLQRTKELGGVILMLTQMVDELVRFFTTFGLIIILFLMVGRFLSEELQYFARATFPDPELHKFLQS